MINTYNSSWKGSQVDTAIGVIINSGVSVDNLAVLKGVALGTVSASKVLVVDSSRNLGSLNILESRVFNGDILDLNVLTVDPVDNPLVDRKYMYLKGTGLYFKDSEGIVSKVNGLCEATWDFSLKTSVVCQHNFGKKYVMVDIIGSNDMPLEGQILYQDVNTVLVSFNHEQSGTIIIRSI